MSRKVEVTEDKAKEVQMGRVQTRHSLIVSGETLCECIGMYVCTYVWTDAHICGSMETRGQLEGD